jgi:hypothetical protein
MIDDDTFAKALKEAFTAGVEMTRKDISAMVEKTICEKFKLKFDCEHDVCFTNADLVADINGDS